MPTWPARPVYTNDWTRSRRTDDDRAAASTKLFDRYARDGLGGSPIWAADLVRAWNAHDLDRLRAFLPADYVFHDRRRTGVGRLDGAEAYLASLAVLWELSSDVRIDQLYEVRTGPNARLAVVRWSGTNDVSMAPDRKLGAINIKYDPAEEVDQRRCSVRWSPQLATSWRRVPTRWRSPLTHLPAPCGCVKPVSLSSKPRRRPRRSQPP